MQQSSMSAFTRGSQIFLHTIRMMGQGTKAASWMGLFCVLGLLLMEIFWVIQFTLKDLYYLGIYIWCYVKLGIGEWFYHPMEIGLSVDDRLVTAASYEAWFWKNAPGIHWMQLYNWFTGPALMQGIVFFGAGFIGTYIFFVIRGRKHLQKKKVRGGDMLTTKDLTRMLKKQGKASSIKIGGLPLAKGSERQHILLTGTTGAGKTNLLHELLPQIRERGEKAIVVDLNGTFVSAYYDSRSDALLNPFDHRTKLWTPWADLEDNWEYDDMASSLVSPDRSDGNFWTDTAKKIIAEAFKQTSSLKEALALLSTHSLEDYAKAFNETSVASITSEAGDKTTNSIRANVNNAIYSLSYLEDITNPWSIKDYMKRPSADWLFIASKPSQRETMRPLMTLWVDVVLKAVMERSFNEDHDNVWLIMDELPALKKVPALATALAEGRKYGLCIVAGIQNLQQIYNCYGRDGGTALLDLFNTRYIFRIGDADTASYSAKLLGQVESLEQSESLSYGANTMRDGVNINTRERGSSLVMPTEIMRLPDLEAYVRLQGHWPITKIQMPYKTPPKIATPFIPNPKKKQLI